MTLKKINRSGQAIFEYFILTIVVVSVILFFAKSPYFTGIKQSSQNAFNQSALEILR